MDVFGSLVGSSGSSCPPRFALVDSLTRLINFLMPITFGRRMSTNSRTAITRIPAMPVEVPIPTFAGSLSFAVDFAVGVDGDEVRGVVGIEELARDVG